jgi:hypothetical protein
LGTNHSLNSPGRSEAASGRRPKGAFCVIFLLLLSCGSLSFVNCFSISAAKIAAHVHALESDRSNFACLQRNFAHIDNVSLNEAALFS